MPLVYPKDVLSDACREVDKASCFVLMPFAEQFDEVYRAILQTLQSPELNLVCRRADDFRTPNILDTILRNIAQSEYILADLTDSNPNVYYELGIAHCIKDAEKVVILAREMASVPFDLRHLRCVLYEQSTSGLEALQRELLATFQVATRNAFRFRVSEGQEIVFAKKLVGKNNNLFDLMFGCLHIGHDAVKLLIHFTVHSFDEVAPPPESQHVFLSTERPSARLENIPWTLHLVQVGQQEALLALERANLQPASMGSGQKTKDQRTIVLSTKSIPYTPYYSDFATQIVKVDTVYKKTKIPAAFLGWPKFTIIFWAEITEDFFQTHNNRYLFSYTTNVNDISGHPNRFSLGISGRSTGWRFLIKGSDPRNETSITFSSSNILLGWKLFSIRWEKEKRKLDFSIDAGHVFQDSRELLPEFWPQYDPKYQFHLGGWQDNWPGGISELRFYGFRVFDIHLLDASVETVLSKEVELLNNA